jgi:hypothetical protein
MLKWTNVSEVHTASIITAMIMEAVHNPETLVYFNVTTWHIPEDSKLHTHHRENLKSHINPDDGNRASL